MSKFLNGSNPSLSIIEKTRMNQNITAKSVVTKRKLEKQEIRETKSILMSMRIRPSTKEKFEKLRAFYGYSQSDFFDALVAIAEDNAVLDGYKE